MVGVINFRLGFLTDFLSHVAIVCFMAGAAIIIALQQFKGLLGIKKGFRIVVLVGMIALTEAVAIRRTFASMKDYLLDGNKEMVALGTMNVVGSMTSFYVAIGSFSCSVVNYMAGCNTAVSNIYTPNAILASIIISAVISLVDIEAMTLIWNIGAFFGAVFSSVEIDLLIARVIRARHTAVYKTWPSHTGM
ncbi:hypothetical protein J1N35_043202 [Gossypium stocksii]|uniref:SLC26A/SulP transporter domain-containing protein n=1 Tax=Gossypium stocksii TaxID=47602 RepID=A0A9D3ZF63_9ROSI|nr:hypothetical protein J1N35_043202 [Gossypium stocksii]